MNKPVSLERLWREARSGHVRLTADPESGMCRCSCGWVDDVPRPAYPVPGWFMASWTMHLDDVDLDRAEGRADRERRIHDRVYATAWAGYALAWARDGDFHHDVIDLICADFGVDHDVAAAHAATIVAGLPRDELGVVIR